MDFTPSDQALGEIRTTFQNLCASLLECYATFKASFDKAGLIPSKKDICMLIGMSGVGKTTCAARLLSPLSPPDFVEALENNGSDFAVIENLLIGHQLGSTTVVPASHLVGNSLHLVDVPGFAENDSTKKSLSRFCRRFS